MYCFLVFLLLVDFILYISLYKFLSYYVFSSYSTSKRLILSSYIASYTRFITSNKGKENSNK
jgi:hypothetical protein